MKTEHGSKPGYQPTIDNMNQIPPQGEEYKCVTGCKTYTGGEIKHHKDCQFYDDSLSQAIDHILTAAKCETVDEVVELLTRQSLTDEDFSFTPLLEKYQHQKPKEFGGDYQERCYPISAVLDMFVEIKEHYAINTNRSELPNILRWLKDNHYLNETEDTLEHIIETYQPNKHHNH